jgi:hypothetical protein
LLESLPAASVKNLFKLRYRFNYHHGGPRQKASKQAFHSPVFRIFAFLSRQTDAVAGTCEKLMV